VLVVSNDRDAVAISEEQLLIRLVVAVQHDPLSRHAPLKSREQFTSRDSIEAETFGGGQRGHGQRTVGLRGVHSQGWARVMTFEGTAIGTAGRTDPCLVEYIKRCAEALSKITEAATTDLQTALIVHFRGHRGQIAIRAKRITAGFKGLRHEREGV